tara:strand:- start:41 stop:529 length:489 start_codon:yes stop_codon:yes gene_type:complete
MSDNSSENSSNGQYSRPDVTITDKLQTKEEMLKRLENYERVEDIDEVSISTHVRYVTLDKEKKQVFRLGGLIKRIHPKYLILSNGRHSWSVQRYHFDDDPDNEEPIFETIFWRVISKESKLMDKIAELEENIELLEDALRNKIEENNRLKDYIRNRMKNSRD